MGAGGNFVKTDYQDYGEKFAVSATKVMVNGDTLFTVTGGPILVTGLVSVCITSNGATASTLQYRSVPTVGTAQTISNASGSLANAAAGATVTLLGTALTTAANLSANGANLGMTAPMVVPAGTLAAVIGTGSTTGTWKHYLRWQPLASGVTVV
jgi:hypothetical protein